jgi:hypothetical protein
MGYVNSKELEACWGRWLRHERQADWESLADGIYKVCLGVATQFHPRTDDEQTDLANHAFCVTMDKIIARKLVFDPGRAPVFNLLTTTVFRILYTYKTTEKRKNARIIRFGRKAFENLSLLEPPGTSIETRRVPFCQVCAR